MMGRTLWPCGFSCQNSACRYVHANVWNLRYPSLIMKKVFMKKANFDHCVSIDFGFQNCLLAQTDSCADIHMYMLI
jgi:hypothetical protein